jgi:hypothetical protein
MQKILEPEAETNMGISEHDRLQRGYSRNYINMQTKQKELEKDIENA